jgi:hypothetical protein
MSLETPLGEATYDQHNSDGHGQSQEQRHRGPIPRCDGLGQQSLEPGQRRREHHDRQRENDHRLRCHRRPVRFAKLPVCFAATVRLAAAIARFRPFRCHDFHHQTQRLPQTLSSHLSRINGQGHDERSRWEVSSVARSSYRSGTPAKCKRHFQKNVSRMPSVCD